jgi:hypothetical protein
MEEVVTSAIPLGRMGQKGDIALACVFLASTAARWGGGALGGKGGGGAGGSCAGRARWRVAIAAVVHNTLSTFMPTSIISLPFSTRFVTGETLVVDGAAWLHRPQLVPREMVSAVSRKVEGSSRAVGVASGGGGARSKL